MNCHRIIRANPPGLDLVRANDCSPLRRITLCALCLLATVRIAFAQTDTIHADSTDILVHPIGHATMVLQSDGRTLFVDPVGDAETFGFFGEPDLILVTDIHGDHLNADVLGAVTTKHTKILAPKAVFDKLPLAERAQTEILANGDTLLAGDIRVEAIPMYNTSPDRKFHEKGRGNGYVVTLSGKRIYISGDTEDIPEMRALKNIDAAFVCMNPPYTMDVDAAADAVLEFKPRIVYPYHYRGQDGMADVTRFRKLVAKDPSIDVRQLDWYAVDAEK